MLASGSWAPFGAPHRRASSWWPGTSPLRQTPAASSWAWSRPPPTSVLYRVTAASSWAWVPASPLCRMTAASWRAWPPAAPAPYAE
uniref:Uncharacterized protein n=1 Tax=Arundo donax TaxID=35708 RepID=A0A0A8XQV2_ARUDO